MMPYYASCDIIGRQNKKKQTEISYQQSHVTQKYQRTCITVLKVLSHYAITIFVL